ncbi:MAG: hypothetical protein FWG94_12000 [Oscillospiraceae bacterium]|nr:hypothetical protein [Oscillospiraceae bacterium]
MLQDGKASTRAKNKYNAKTYDSLRIVVTKGKKSDLQEHASNCGESLNGFVNRAIDETVERDKAGEKPKNKRGRPKGSKNKPRGLSMAEIIAEAEEESHA